MKRELCTYVEGYPSGYAIGFHAEISGRHVVVEVKAETLLKLAEILTKHTNHVGHAAWHINNPEAAIPCSTCAHRERAAA